MTGLTGDELANEIGDLLPYLRRYARALTGRQQSGDSFAVATLEAILSDPAPISQETDLRVALFRAFHNIWASTGATVDPSSADTGLEKQAQKRLAQLTPNTREALLLRTIEEFRVEQIARILGVEEEEAAELVDIAYAEMARSVSGRILIIEDEAIIAMDLESMVSDLGHDVVGIARTEKGAIDLAASQDFDMILSDIQLADNSSGIDAVNRILDTHGDCPVIFITAFPERLLTGKGPEPAFLITKPYTEEQVKSAVSQAMFFASSEAIKV
ncbi:response regulator [Aestuariivita boseongensis]|uniref:response regulator n=1 Tax=Aestuariivita boseongensis TaxID=1470562 RepID=UPI000681F9F6|nr:response regulator [Aestuariivita boseongensis]